MARTYPPLSQQIERVMREEVEQKVLLITKKMALTLLRKVIQKSPVDSGRFRGNWQLEVGAEPSGTLNVVNRAAKGTMPTETFSPAAASVQKALPFEPIYIVNNLPYAQALENGHSKQAPAGVLAVSVAELRAEAPALVKQFVRTL